MKNGEVSDVARANDAPGADIRPDGLLRKVAIGVGLGVVAPALAVGIASIGFGWGFSDKPADWWSTMQALGSIWAAALTLIYLAITLPLVTTALTQARAATASADSAAVQAEASKVQAEVNLRMLELMAEERREDKQRLWMPLKVAVEDRIQSVRALRSFGADQPVAVFVSHELNTGFAWFTQEFEAQAALAMGLIPHYSQALRSASDELKRMDLIISRIKEWATEDAAQSQDGQRGEDLYKQLQNAGVRARHHLILIQRRIAAEVEPFAPPYEEVPSSTV